MILYFYISGYLSFELEIKLNKFVLRLSLHNKDCTVYIDILKIILDLRFSKYVYFDIISIYENNKLKFNLIKYERGK